MLPNAARLNCPDKGNWLPAEGLQALGLIWANFKGCTLQRGVYFKVTVGWAANLQGLGFLPLPVLNLQGVAAFLRNKVQADAGSVA